MVAEIQRTVKALLGYGARMPKELMLFVKNLVFLDGAIATLAPDLDLIGEMAHISMYFANTHGERLGPRARHRPPHVEIDLDGFKAEPRRRLLNRAAHLPRTAGATSAHQQTHARTARTRRRADEAETAAKT